jgi:hypothetical protein
MVSKYQKCLKTTVIPPKLTCILDPNTQFPSVYCAVYSCKIHEFTDEGVWHKKQALLRVKLTMIFNANSKYLRGTRCFQSHILHL